MIITPKGLQIKTKSFERPKEFAIISRYGSYPGLATGVPPEEKGGNEGNDDGKGEAEGVMFQAVDEVHAEEAGDQCRHHEEHADERERLHHRRHIVVDDVGVGVHGGFEDVGVDASHLARLVHLDAYVLDEVGVEFVDGQLELQLRE